MSNEAHDLPPEQKRWAFFAAALFLTAIGFLGFAIAEGAMLTFAFGWVALQVLGFVGAISITKGDFAHPLFKAQVMVHLVALGLLVALFLRGAA